MITDEKTKHYHNRVIRRERDLESMAGKPVLLRRILPLVRRRVSRSSLSLHCLDSRARGWLKPRIPPLEKKTCWRRDGKTREGETVQVKWASSDSWNPFVLSPRQHDANRTSPRPSFSSHSIRSSASP